jgi:hypothetical protein
MTYKPLRTDFTAKGFHHVQLKREGDIALFSKTGESGGVHSEPFDAGFEVIVVGRHDGYEFNGVKAEPAESYPSNEMWGVKGWTYSNLASAEKRFAKLVKAGTKAVANNAEQQEQEETPVMETQPTSVPTLNEVKKLKAVNINLPDKEFTMQELMVFNNSGRSKVYFALQDLIQNGTVVEVRRDQKGKGRATVIYNRAS